MRFKIEPMQHQHAALAAMAGREAFALLMEQRTGKTKVVIDDFSQRFIDDDIDNVFVLAPNGVHIKWVTDELPKHLSPDVQASARYYKRRKRHPDFPYQPGVLRILTMSYDSLCTKEGFAYAIAFCQSGRTYAVSDESQRIKNKEAIRTKQAFKIANVADIRRIMTGTLTPNGPFDAWSQMMWLDPDILNRVAFSAFKAEHALMHSTKSGLLQHIMMQNPGLRKTIHALPKDTKGKPDYSKLDPNRIPKVMIKDAQGNPIYRNLDRLHRQIAPHSFRILRKDCLDLPPKIHETQPFELTEEQRRIYEGVRKELRAEFGNKIMLPSNKMVAMIRLQQITSGILKFDEDERPTLLFADDDNPRLQVFKEMTEDNESQTIIWAKWDCEVEAILRILGNKAERADGAINVKRRTELATAFQAGEFQYIVSKAQALGAGFTLNAATWMIYYSNSFNLEHRLQSEDRAEGIGQTQSVTITDIRAIDTIDDRIVSALQSKQDVSRIIAGDDL